MHVHALTHVLRRERLPLLLLGRELQKRGCEFEECFLNVSSNRLFPGSEPRLRLIPFLYDDENARKNLCRARWLGEAVLNLCWEQFRSTWNRARLMPEGAFVENGMVCLSWGTKYRDALVSHGYDPKRIRVAGNLRMDLTMQPGLLFSREWLAKRHGLDAGRPWLLVAWNLQLADGNTEWLQRVMRRHKLNFPDEIIAATKASRDAHCELIARLPDLLPDHEIILRAHPSAEDTAELKKRFGERAARLHAINDLDIANWIKESALVFGWTSTSLCEAAAAKVPALCFEPVPYSEPFDYDVGRIIPRASTMEEAVSFLRAPQQLPSRVNWPLYREWYGEADGRAYERVADVCMELLENFGEHQTPSDLLPSRHSRVRNALRRIVYTAPSLAPALAWAAHGRHRKTNHFMPKAVAQGVMDGKGPEAAEYWLA
jgi:surface carbohydrate biosynthesis protein